MDLISRHLPMTRLRLFGASLVSQALRVVFGSDSRVIERQGTRFEIDLAEGIDLSVFLLGGFQSKILNLAETLVEEDAVVIDVGANIGSMTLPIAKYLEKGRVVALEPTDFAFRKLECNLSLNPEIAQRVTALQVFADATTDHEVDRVYASWRLGKAIGAHPVHGGIARTANGASVVTLDRLVAELELSRVDLIKIDTDGHELRVLRGAEDILSTQRPFVIFEIGLYLLEEHGTTYEDFAALFSRHGYKIFDLQGNQVEPLDYRRFVPVKSTTDLVAIPS